MKVRQNLYLDQKVVDGLDRLAARPGGNKSRLVNDALAGWLARRGTDEVVDKLQPRLDRFLRELGAIRRENEVLRESFALFVRYQLTVSPPLADNDKVGLAIGRDRFEAFVRQVGKALADGVVSIGSNQLEGQGA